MPKKNGMQVFTEVKEYFKMINLMSDDGVEVLEPKIVFLSSYMTPSFKQHVENKEAVD